MITIDITGDSGDRQVRIIQAGLVVHEGILKDSYRADNLYCEIGKNITKRTIFTVCHHDNNTGIDL